jgi:hypothetical protein
VIVEPSQEMPDERRFATADFASDYGETGAVHDAKLEHGERQSVILTPVDQIRIRQDRKRLFPEPIKYLVHRKTLKDTICLKA